MDGPTRVVSVGSDWQLFQIPFSEFARAGFGSWQDGEDHRPEPLALDETYQLQFAVPLAESFDVYFDNVGLIVPE